MKWLVTVTLEFTEEVEAPTAEEAEDMVRNLDWADIPKTILVDVGPSE